jgi:4-hydroxybenzoate polyprenyltransferase/phosphoserine phosphatase
MATIPRAVEPPLCVDLDGTLIAGDLLWESVVRLARRSPLSLLLLPLWLLRGKAHLKAQLARRVTLDPRTLPYRDEVLAFLRAERAAGRSLVLATASNERLAVAVAGHLGLFDEVLASDERTNLKGRQKLTALEEQFGPAGFDYVGDSAADLPVWAGARHGYVVHPSRRLLAKADAANPLRTVAAPPGGALRAAVRLLRPHQWSKNLLLFVPLVLSHHLGEGARVLASLLAFAAFCCTASAGYVLNDLLDLEADRRHPAKRSRPLAAGTLSIPAGVVLGTLLSLAGLGLALALSGGFAGILLLYAGLTVTYSLHLKREPLLDVFLLAGLYTIRILAGGLAIGVAISGWLLAFSIFFFFSLAVAKRYAELLRVSGEQGERLDGRGYRVEDGALLQSVGPASGYLAVLTFGLYINAPDVLRFYTRPGMLWAVCLVLFYWITRVWFLAQRRELNEDPVSFAVRDRVSYLCGAVALVVLLAASA